MHHSLQIMFILPLMTGHLFWKATTLGGLYWGVPLYSQLTPYRGTHELELRGNHEFKLWENFWQKYEQFLGKKNGHKIRKQPILPELFGKWFKAAVRRSTKILTMYGDARGDFSRDMIRFAIMGRCCRRPSAFPRQQARRIRVACWSSTSIWKGTKQELFDTSRLGQYDHHFEEDIFECIFSDYAQPIMIGWAQPQLAPSKRQKTGPDSPAIKPTSFIRCRVSLSFASCAAMVSCCFLESLGSSFLVLRPFLRSISWQKNTGNR